MWRRSWFSKQGFFLVAACSAKDVGQSPGSVLSYLPISFSYEKSRTVSLNKSKLVDNLKKKIIHSFLSEINSLKSSSSLSSRHKLQNSFEVTLCRRLFVAISASHLCHSQSGVKRCDLYARDMQVFINLPNPINVTHVFPFHKCMQFLSSVPFKILLSNWFPSA